MKEETSPISGVIISRLEKYEDQRGWLSEFYRADMLDHQPAMAYISSTLPGQSRGPHEHLYQTDLFIFADPGEFKLYVWDNRPESPTYRQKHTDIFGGEHQALVIVPPRIVHAYRCVSEVSGLVINLPDKLYAGVGKSQPVDEIRHEDLESPFILD